MEKQLYKIIKLEILARISLLKVCTTIKLLIKVIGSHLSQKTFKVILKKK